MYLSRQVYIGSPQQGHTSILHKHQHLATRVRQHKLQDLRPRFTATQTTQTRGYLARATNVATAAGLDGGILANVTALLTFSDGTPDMMFLATNVPATGNVLLMEFGEIDYVRFLNSVPVNVCPSTPGINLFLLAALTLCLLAILVFLTVAGVLHATFDPNSDFGAAIREVCGSVRTPSENKHWPGGFLAAFEVIKALGPWPSHPSS